MKYLLYFKENAWLIYISKENIGRGEINNRTPHRYNAND